MEWSTARLVVLLFSDSGALREKESEVDSKTQKWHL